MALKQVKYSVKYFDKRLRENTKMYTANLSKDIS